MLHTYRFRPRENGPTLSKPMTSQLFILMYFQYDEPSNLQTDAKGT